MLADIRVAFVVVDLLCVRESKRGRERRKGEQGREREEGKGGQEGALPLRHGLTHAYTTTTTAKAPEGSVAIDVDADENISAQTALKAGHARSSSTSGIVPGASASATGGTSRATAHIALLVCDAIRLHHLAKVDPVRPKVA